MSKPGEQKRRLVRITNLGKYRVSLGPLRRSLLPGDTIELLNLPKDWITMRILRLIDKGTIQVEERELTVQEIQELRDDEARAERRDAEAQAARTAALTRLVERGQTAKRNRNNAARRASKLKKNQQKSAEPVEPAPRVFLPDDCDSTTGGSNGEPEQN